MPLGFYLFSVMTLPGYLWWCVAMLQVPLQAAAFAAMALHLEYVRTRRFRWVALTAVALAFGALCDVKVAFVGVGLAFLSLYLSDATTWRQRVVDAVWRQRYAWLTYAVIFGAYLGLYLALNPVGGRESTDRLPVFEVMFRHTLGPVLAGGPWEWGLMTDTPLVPAQSPEWAITLTWVVLVLLLVQAVRRYRPVAWALVPLLVCVAVNVVMVSTARGAIFGSRAGPGGALPRRPQPHRHARARRCWPRGCWPAAVRRRSRRCRPRGGRVRRASPSPACVVAAVVGAVVSNQRYVANWHSDYPAREFTQNVIRQSEEQQLRIVDVPVPKQVIPSDDIVATFGVPSRVFKPLGDRVVASLQGNDLGMLDEHGIVHTAAVFAQAQAAPGPVEGCGYQVGTDSVSAELVPVPGTDPLDAFWWGSIGYLASEDGVVKLSLGDTEVRMTVSRGLHTFLFLGAGQVAEARMTSATDTVVCVDQVSVGLLVPLPESGS